MEHPNVREGTWIIQRSGSEAFIIQLSPLLIWDSLTGHSGSSSVNIKLMMAEFHFAGAC